METKKAIIVFEISERKESFDLEIPLDISANDLIIALNSAFKLGIDVSDIKKCYLSSEHPIALIRGDKSLKEFGIRDGSLISFNG